MKSIQLGNGGVHATQCVTPAMSEWAIPDIVDNTGTSSNTSANQSGRNVASPSGVGRSVHSSNTRVNQGWRNVAVPDGVEQSVSGGGTSAPQGLHDVNPANQNPVRATEPGAIWRPWRDGCVNANTQVLIVEHIPKAILKTIFYKL